MVRYTVSEPLDTNLFIFSVYDRIVYVFPIEHVNCEKYVLFHPTGGLLTILAISVLMCTWSKKSIGLGRFIEKSND